MLKNENNKRHAFLVQLNIKKDELSMGSRMHSDETSPEMRHIRVLENRLDKAATPLKCCVLGRFLLKRV